jgi:hypothetical protein
MLYPVLQFVFIRLNIYILVEETLMLINQLNHATYKHFCCKIVGTLQYQGFTGDDYLTAWSRVLLEKQF